MEWIKFVSIFTFNNPTKFYRSQDKKTHFSVQNKYLYIERKIIKSKLKSVKILP